jgi:hypothetical protein
MTHIVELQISHPKVLSMPLGIPHSAPHDVFEQSHVFLRRAGHWSADRTSGNVHGNFKVGGQG